MSSNDKNVPHSLPIPIEGRRRSRSVSDSSSDSDSTSPASPLPNPASGALPRIAPISPSTSPILSYFLSQSPSKSPSATFPFRRGSISGPQLEDEDSESDKSIARRGRLPSATAWASPDRFPPVGHTPAAPVPGHQQERAAGLLRRLSLGGNMTRPPISVPKPVNGSAQAPRSPTPPRANPTTARKPRRANTLATGTPRPPRAPSPMGERILKGHFDGFN